MYTYTKKTHQTHIYKILKSIHSSQSITSQIYYYKNKRIVHGYNHKNQYFSRYRVSKNKQQTFDKLKVLNYKIIQYK